MHEPQLLVCERSDRWTVVWRRALGQATAVRHCGSISHADECLRVHPRIPVAIDANGYSSEHLLSAIVRWSQNGAPVIVLASPAEVEHELFFRELEAVHAVFSPRQISSAVRLIRRYWQQLDAVPPENSPLEQTVYSRLPWAKYARGGS